MDILGRLFRIARAHLNAGREIPWPDQEAAWEAPPADPGPTRPPQDPRLAGYYANLEVPYGADLEAVRRAWRKLLKKYHPDLQGDDPERRRVANELTAQLTHAYRELEKILGGQRKPPHRGR